MLPAKNFELPKSLQVGFCRVPDDIIAPRQAMQADLARGGAMWISVYTTVVEQTHGGGQVYQAFVADWIFMGKTVDPLAMQQLRDFRLAPYRPRRCGMQFQKKQS